MVSDCADVAHVRRVTFIYTYTYDVVNARVHNCLGSRLDLAS